MCHAGLCCLAGTLLHCSGGSDTPHFRLYKDAEMGFNSCQAQQWSNEQVLQWLGTIGLTQLVPRFQQEEGEF